MDLDAFLNKKSKKLAGGKKKAKTGELSEKERAELGLDVFGGLDSAPSITPEVTRAGSGHVPSNEGTVASPIDNRVSGVVTLSSSAPVEAVATDALEEDDGDHTEVVMQVVKTSEKKVKGWDDVKPASASVGDLLAKAAEKSGPRRFVARGKDESTGPLGRGANLSSADLPTLEEVVSGNAKKTESSPASPLETAGAKTAVSSGVYQPPTEKPSMNADVPSTNKTEGTPISPTEKSSAGAYKPPTDRPSAGAYKPPTDRKSAGAYKPPTDRPSAGAYKPPTEKPSMNAEVPSTNKTEGTPISPTDKSSAEAYKPPTDRPSAGAYKPPTDRPSAGAYKPPTDRPLAGVYKPPSKNNALPSN
ncbi:translation initiation factor IF-2 [Trypanosoma cruzi]|nr:translation initiation factor IF-2 [Trypanosoma cruzi]